MKHKLPPKSALPQLLKQSLSRMALLPQRRPILPIEKLDESLTPNMRALRMVMTIADQLLSMGVAARDVVHMALGITETYCKRQVHMDISSTLITVSQDRGIDREPLTLIRTIVLRDVNYRTIQALQSLALTIRDHHTPLDEAEERLERILEKPKSYPEWVLGVMGGVLSAGVVIMYGSDVLMTTVAFLVGLSGTFLLRWLWQIPIPSFYARVITALFSTLVAAMTAYYAASFNLAINPTLIVISGIVLLVAGMMIVGAFQDAIDEFYVTANARLLRVTMATAGIVIGVMVGLYIARKIGVTFPATPDRLSLAGGYMQYVGAMIVAAAFAASNHASFFGMVVSGLVSALGWWLSRVLLNAEFDVIIASGIAGAAMGLMATFLSRIWKIPSLAIIGAGILPLVPGLSLYNGLMGLISHPPSDPGFMLALAVLARAVMIGFAVAVGASFGNMIGRPIRRRVIKLFNKPPGERTASPR